MITFEEVKELFKESIDATDTMNKALEHLMQSIYQKGYNEALEQEPCEDCISRQGAIIQLSHNKTGGDDCDVIIQKDIETIKALPSVTPQPKTGHWKRVELGLFDSVSIRWECSECKKSDRYRSNFCFNCGAKMESEDKE
jgi:hypothetical protein